VPRAAPAGTVQLTGYVRCSPAPKLSFWNHFWNARLIPPGVKTTTPITAEVAALLVTVVLTVTVWPVVVADGVADETNVKFDSDVTKALSVGAPAVAPTVTRVTTSSSSSQVTPSATRRSRRG